MNRVRVLATGTMLLFAMAMFAQQTVVKPGGPAQGVPGGVSGGVAGGVHDGVGQEGGAQAHGDAHGRGMPTAEEHLKMLSEKLDLTSDQQDKIRPILQAMQDGTQKAMQAEGLSRDERMAKVKEQREKADKQVREFLNDDQKKKLDELEHQPHSGLHGGAHGATQPTPPPQ